MSTAVSPLAPTDVPEMPAIAGVKLATAAAGIRYQGRTDVLLVLLDPGTAVAGVFTQSKCASAPVEWCQATLKTRKARALVVNSGNANAFTGKTGRDAAKFTADIAALVIIMVEISMGLFLMESLRITRLFPVIGALSDKMRVRMIFVTFTILLLMASIEAPVPSGAERSTWPNARLAPTRLRQQAAMPMTSSEYPVILNMTALHRAVTSAL